jgi:hypothetical protein
MKIKLRTDKESVDYILSEQEMMEIRDCSAQIYGAFECEAKDRPDEWKVIERLFLLLRHMDGMPPIPIKK